MRFLTPEQVLFIHARLIAETGGEHGVRDLGLLASAVARPQAVFEGKALYKDIYAKAAALFESLVNNHPFIDGNKRTGITSAALFLRLNGYRLTASNLEIEKFVLSVASGEKTFESIADWFRKNTSLNE